MTSPLGAIHYDPDFDDVALCGAVRADAAIYSVTAAEEMVTCAACLQQMGTDQAQAPDRRRTRRPSRWDLTVIPPTEEAIERSQGLMPSG